VNIDKRLPDESSVSFGETELSHSGPLPAPWEFEYYEKILPGAAERLLSAVENEASHRHAIDHKIVDDIIRSGRLGQYFAFAVVILSLLSVVAIAAFKLPTVAVIVPAIIASTGMAAIFLPSRK